MVTLLRQRTLSTEVYLPTLGKAVPKAARMKTGIAESRIRRGDRHELSNHKMSKTSISRLQCHTAFLLWTCQETSPGAEQSYG